MTRVRRGRGGGLSEAGTERWVEAESQGCRLLAHCPMGLDPGPLLAIEAVAGLLLEGEPAVELVARIHAAGRAAFLVDRTERVRPLGADGVLLGRPAEVAGARRLLDRGELIGAAVGASRHDAMVAGEDGADYVLFGAFGIMPAGALETLAAHVAWWSGIAVLPCVAAGPFVPDDARRLAAAGADFLLPDTADAARLAALVAALPAPER